MDCNVIQDLMILCSDNCCSEESKKLINEHIVTCDNCKKAYKEIKDSLFTETRSSTTPYTKLKSINLFKASLIQTLLFFLSFILLTVGVTLEASTPSGNTNGIWAMSIIIPTTGFLLSLTNWYFLRNYKSKKSFSISSLFITIGITLCGYIWALFHYKISAINIFSTSFALIIGVILILVFCLMSPILSDIYAQLTGKE